MKKLMTIAICLLVALTFTSPTVDTPKDMVIQAETEPSCC